MNGAEHEDPPEADHDARHRRKHVDERPDRPADDGGASSLRKRPIAIESGAANRTAPKEVTSVPMMNSRAPKTSVTGFHVLFQTKAIPNVADRGPRAFDDLPNDRGDDEQRRARRRERRQHEERGSPMPVEDMTRPAQARRRVTPAAAAFHARQLSSASAAARGSVTTSSHDVHMHVYPGSAATGETRAGERRGAAPLDARDRTGTDRSAVADADRRRRTAAGDGLRHQRSVRLTTGSALAVSDVSLEIHKNAITALIGPPAAASRPSCAASTG